jgi:hypothetical protein
LSVTALAASYYGLVAFLAVAVLVSATVLGRRGAIRQILPAVLVAGLTLVVVVGPVWLQYARLERDPHFRRSPAPELAASAADLGRVPATSTHLAALPLLQPDRNPETPIFPGIAMGGLAVAGLVVLLLRRDTARRRELVGLAAMGVLMLVLSGGGSSWILGPRAVQPYQVLARLVPAFAGVRAPARFALLFELGVATCAAVALGALRRWSLGVFAVVLTASLCTLAIESRTHIPEVRLPTTERWTAVNRELSRSAPGLAVELPAVGEQYGWVWGYTEAPRMFLAIRDGHQRVNGYSGFEPAGFDADAALLNSFPSPSSVRWLRDHRVRYVVVRRTPVGHVSTKQGQALDEALPRLDDAAIEALSGQRPYWLRASKVRGDAILFELDPDRGASQAHGSVGDAVATSRG